MNTYQPKINLEAMRMGYIGADPRAVGLTGGYQTRLTPPTQSNKPSAPNGKRPNPYIK